MKGFALMLKFLWGFEFQVVINTSRTISSLGSNDRAGWQCLRGEGPQLASDRGSQRLPPAPLFVLGGLEPAVEWEMLLCFASSQIPSSTSAAAKLLAGSFLKVAQPRGRGAPVPLGAD